MHCALVGDGWTFGWRRIRELGSNFRRHKRLIGVKLSAAESRHKSSSFCGEFWICIQSWPLSPRLQMPPSTWGCLSGMCFQDGFLHPTSRICMCCEEESRRHILLWRCSQNYGRFMILKAILICFCHPWKRKNYRVWGGFLKAVGDSCSGSELDLVWVTGCNMRTRQYQSMCCCAPWKILSVRVTCGSHI